MVAGPGLVVMLADTDAGSVITAAQSGAQWGYGLLFFQFVLIPILYMVQEFTVRLGLVMGKGHADDQAAFRPCLGLGVGDDPDCDLPGRATDRAFRLRGRRQPYGGSSCG